MIHIHVSSIFVILRGFFLKREPTKMDLNKNRIPDNVQRIHLIAICGTGMAALFRANPPAAVGLGLVVFVVGWWTVVRYRRSRAVGR